MITGEPFRQIGEDSDPMVALLEMDFTVRRDVHQERAGMNEAVWQHGEDIESFKKQIDDKNK